MDDQSPGVKFRRNGCRVKPAGCRSDQHHFADFTLSGQTGHRMAGHKGPKRKAGQTQITLRRPIPDHRQQVIQLAMPLVIDAFAAPHTPEIEAHSSPTRQHKRTRQRLNHLVGHGAAKERVGVCNHSHATGLAVGPVNGQFQRTRRAGQLLQFGLGVHQRPTVGGVSKRSTTTPSRRCDSTISSMSL